jgi:hypothetical protein
LVDAVAIAGSQHVLEADEFFGHGIEETRSPSESSAPFDGAAFLAKDVLEHDSRMSFRRERSRRRGPGKIVLIDAGVTVIALTHDGQQVH